MNFFKYLKKLINILDKLEAVSSILEDISKTASKSVKEHSKTLPISEKVLKKIDRTASKISDFDKTLEDIKKENSMKLTENFYLHEFVTRHLHKKWKDRSVIFLDDRIIYLAQWIRERFGKPMVINTWKNEMDGGWNYRGWRPANCSVGTPNSQHKSGRAIDFHIEGITVEEVYEDIWKNEGTYHSYGLRCVEEISKTPTWIHIDCRTTFTDYKILKV